MTSGSRRIRSIQLAIETLRHAALCVLLVVAMFALVGCNAHAQDATGYDSLIEAARDGGATVIVIEPGGEEADPVTSSGTPFVFRLGSTLADVRAALIEIFGGSRNFITDLGMAVRDAAPGEPGTGWVLTAVLLAGIAVAAGYMAARLFRRWARGYFRYVYDPNPQTRSAKIGYLLFRAFLFMVGSVIMFGVGMAVMLGLAPEHGSTRAFGVITLSVLTTVRVLQAVFLGILAPDAPGHRMIAMSDEASLGLYRALIGVFILSGTIFGLCVWFDMIGFAKNPHLLMLIATTGISAVLLSIVAIVYRRPVANAIRAAGGEDPSIAVNVLAALWHVVLVVYFVAAWAIGSAQLVLREPTSFWLVFGPVLAVLAMIGLYGLLILLIDRWFGPDPAEIAGAEELEVRGGRIVFKPVAEQGAAIAVGVVLLLMILRIWGVRPLQSDSEFRWFVDLAIVIGIAILGYKAAKLWIDQKIAEETPTPEPGEMDEMGGTGQSRLATLLPIFRNVALAGIIAIAGMMALAELGVDIGPLFAGAGIIGIAIGFGAQTLVRDVFSGAFFLIDDAFRKGEYIDIGSVKGTVEKISMRSFQLRHHNGPLHTVPFGEIQQLTNFSRDWVMMKLPLRVTYDTDVERVRKLIKKLGQEMLEDPEIGDKFLQPLKSQGVLQMEDSAMIIRVKFMTKPGDQFVVRRHVYTRIRDLFEREGIRFAHRQVTVRLADDDDDEDHAPSKLTQKEKEAIGAAVAPIIEQEELAAAGEAAPADDR